MTSWVTPPRRSRNTILEALQAFEALDLPRGFHCFCVFLYVCENEGLTITELAHLINSAVSVVARTVKLMSGQAVEGVLPSSEALLELRAAEDRRIKLIYLTSAGCALRDRLEILIESARPIRLNRDGAVIQHQSSSEWAP